MSKPTLEEYGKQLALNYIERQAKILKDALDITSGYGNLKIRSVTFKKKIYGHEAEWEYLIELEEVDG